MEGPPTNPATAEMQRAGVSSQSWEQKMHARYRPSQQIDGMTTLNSLCLGVFAPTDEANRPKQKS